MSSVNSTSCLNIMNLQIMSFIYNKRLVLVNQMSDSTSAATAANTAIIITFSVLFFIFVVAIFLWPLGCWDYHTTEEVVAEDLYLHRLEEEEHHHHHHRRHHHHHDRKKRKQRKRHNRSDSESSSSSESDEDDQPRRETSSSGQISIRLV